MANAGCLLFPFKVDNSTDSLQKAYTIEDTLLSTIRSFLVTRKGSRVGNNIGSFLPELLLQAIPTSQIAGLATELKNELVLQFPGVQFLLVSLDKNVTNNVSDLVVSITFTVANQSTISKLVINLPSVFTPNSNFQAIK